MITSTANAKIKRIIQMQKKRKARDEEGLFQVEGIRMFREIPPRDLQEIYVSQSFWEKEESLVREMADRACIRPELVSDSVFEHLSATRTPQGILCVVEQFRYRLEDLTRRENPHLLILENLQDPGNLGTILRTAEGAGVTGVILSKGSVDLYNPKTIRSTMGSVYRVPALYTEDLGEIAELLRDRGIRTFAAHLRGKHFYDQEDYRGRTAFFIGNEGAGLTEELSSKADTLIRIPMEGKVESLNAGVAASLLAYEAYRQRRR